MTVYLGKLMSLRQAFNELYNYCNNNYKNSVNVLVYKNKILYTIYDIKVALDQTNLDDYKEYIIENFMSLYNKVLVANTKEEINQIVTNFFQDVFCLLIGKLSLHNISASFNYPYTNPLSQQIIDNLKCYSKVNYDDVFSNISISKQICNVFSYYDIDFTISTDAGIDTTLQALIKEYFESKNKTINNYCFCNIGNKNDLLYTAPLVRYKDKGTDSCNNENSFKKIVRTPSEFFRGNRNFDMVIGSYHYLDFDSSKKDREYFYRNINYLRVGGLYITPINIGSMNIENIEFYSLYLKNISLIHLVDNDYILIGERKLKRQRESDEIFNDLLSQVVNNKYKKVKYNITGESVEDILFRTTILSEKDLLKDLNKNPNIYNFFKENSLRKYETKSVLIDKKPMLPFNPGQLGLALVSGYIDGVISDNNGIPHTIKGTTYNSTDRTQETDENGNTVTISTHRKSTSVKMFLANGRYVQLS